MLINYDYSSDYSRTNNNRTNFLKDFISNNGHGDMDTGVFFGILLTVLLVIEIGIISNIIEEPKPTPMDVYQGKTTLEYTIRDGIKVDSVVVFKNSVYEKD